MTGRSAAVLAWIEHHGFKSLRHTAAELKCSHEMVRYVLMQYRPDLLRRAPKKLKSEPEGLQ